MVWEASCKVHGGAEWEGKGASFGASFRASSGELEFGRKGREANTEEGGRK